MIKGVIGRVISNLTSAQREADLKLRARLHLNSTTQSPIANLFVPITKYEELLKSTVKKRQSPSKENKYE